MQYPGGLICTSAHKKISGYATVCAGICGNAMRQDLLICNSSQKRISPKMQKYADEVISWYAKLYRWEGPKGLQMYAERVVFGYATICKNMQILATSSYATVEEKRGSQGMQGFLSK
jgi:hypothetical protein